MEEIKKRCKVIYKLKGASGLEYFTRSEKRLLEGTILCLGRFDSTNCKKLTLHQRIPAASVSSGLLESVSAQFLILERL
jgi:hypothetical protein